MPHILVVDDEKNYLAVLSALLEEEGYRVSTADNAFAALEILSRDDVSLILSDLRMPRMDGLTFLRQIRERSGDVPFIILTAFATVDTALEAMKRGAFDYLLKPFNNEEILLAVRKALDFSRLQIENDLLRRQLERERGQEILGASAPIRRLREEIALVGPARTSVLIAGETGTGKELVARALHRASPRAGGPLVSLNCAAIAENLLESELFGHERGAFTGASERKRGLIEAAGGGTLFLDEIGELPLPLQPKLLRVLQERRFRRVGGTAEIESDVRIIAATHRDLQEMAAAGEFREDLLYRLHVVGLRVPPLRERPEDIPLLALHALQRLARDLDRRVETLAPETLRLLQGYGWPGNVRELQNVIERGVLFCSGGVLLPEHLPEHLRILEETVAAPLPAGRPLDRPLPEFLDLLERELILQALVQTRGVQAQAAEILGISRSNLQYKLKKHGLDQRDSSA